MGSSGYAFKVNRTCVRQLQQTDHSQQCSFSGAVRAQKRQDFARFDFEMRNCKDGLVAVANQDVAQV
jgi:hypothetical protein